MLRERTRTNGATTLINVIRTRRQHHANTGRLSRYGMMLCCSHCFSDTKQESLKLSALAELHMLRTGSSGAKTCPFGYMQRRQSEAVTQNFPKPIPDELGSHLHCPQSLCSTTAPAMHCPSTPTRTGSYRSADAQHMSADLL